MTTDPARSEPVEIEVHTSGLGESGLPTNRLRNLAAVCLIVSAIGFVGFFFRVSYQLADGGTPEKSISNDFSVFWGAARIALEGSPIDAFDLGKLEQARNLPASVEEGGRRMAYIPTTVLRADFAAGTIVIQTGMVGIRPCRHYRILDRAKATGLRQHHADHCLRVIGRPDVRISRPEQPDGRRVVGSIPGQSASRPAHSGRRAAGLPDDKATIRTAAAVGTHRLRKLASDRLGGRCKSDDPDGDAGLGRA